MPLYRVLLTDAAGRTAAAHLPGPFDSEAEVLALAHTGLAPGDQVQVWCDDRRLDIAAPGTRTGHAAPRG